MRMATLRRRVQIRFDPVQYAALEEEEAAANKQSVASIIQEAVADRLDRRKRSKRVAFELLLSRSAAAAVTPPGNWQKEKDEFERARWLTFRDR
jgi:hypothetical protein